MAEVQIFTPPSPLNTSVLFLVFNRPDVTAQVFEAIREAKPPRLYIAADGPRANKLGEAERCEKVRRIATNVDWPCEVKTLFRERNLGCKLGVSEGINWFFQQEEEGIILEDDCLPSQSFFYFAEYCLKKYKKTSNVWQVSGFRFTGREGATQKLQPDAYAFSRYGSIWGWATWKRAWEKYDIDVINLTKSSQLEYKLNSMKRIERPDIRFEQIEALRKGLDTWDFQWFFSRLLNDGLAVVPPKSLIANIGFGNDDATHTSGKCPPAWRINSDLTNPLVSPIKIERNFEVERDHLLTVFPSFIHRILIKFGLHK